MTTVEFGDGPVAADLIEAASCISFCNSFVSATAGIVAVHVKKQRLLPFLLWFVVPHALPFA